MGLQVLDSLNEEEIELYEEGWWMNLKDIQEIHNEELRYFNELIKKHPIQMYPLEVIIHGIDVRVRKHIKATTLNFEVPSDVEDKRDRFKALASTCYSMNIAPYGITILSEIWKRPVDASDKNKIIYHDKVEGLMITSTNVVGDASLSLADTVRDNTGRILPPEFKTTHYEFDPFNPDWRSDLNSFAFAQAYLKHRQENGLKFSFEINE